MAEKTMKTKGNTETNCDAMQEDGNADGTPTEVTGQERKQGSQVKTDGGYEDMPAEGTGRRNRTSGHTVRSPGGLLEIMGGVDRVK